MRPFITPFAFNGEANSGDSVQLTCHVSKGDLPIKIHWLHNNLKIHSNLGVLASKMGDRISLLTVSSVSAINSGIYSCIATNFAGVFNQSAELFVNG